MWKHIGEKEITQNDSPKIRKWLKNAGINYPASYCSAYVKAGLDECGIKNTVNAWSPTAFNKKNIVYFNRKFNKEVKTGDVFVLYSLSNKRISHTGFVKPKNSKFYITSEGNTSSPNSTDSYNGDGVYSKIRSYNATYGISRWSN